MRRGVVVAAVIVVFLLAGEAAARLLEPGLSSAGAWPKGRIAEQYDAVMERAEAGDVDVVFAGSSMMQKAVDPELFSRQTGLRSINAALPASTNFMLGPWLEDVVLPMLHPDTVVIGVASRDFNDNGRGPDRALASFVGSPGYRTLVADDWLTDIDRALASFVGSPGYRSLVADDWLTDIDRAVSEYSALVRVRRSLRDPGNVAKAIGRSRPSIPTLRCPPAHPGAERYRIDPTVARYPFTVLNDYSAGGVQTTELIDTINALDRRGVEVVLVEMATSSDYAILHPDPVDDLADHRAALERVVEVTDVPVMDATTALRAKRFFRDPIHLNCTGARRFTEAVTRYLQNRLR